MVPSQNAAREQAADAAEQAEKGRLEQKSGAGTPPAALETERPELLHLPHRLVIAAYMVIMAPMMAPKEKHRGQHRAEDPQERRHRLGLVGVEAHLPLGLERETGVALVVVASMLRNPRVPPQAQQHRGVG